MSRTSCIITFFFSLLTLTSIGQVPDSLPNLQEVEILPGDSSIIEDTADELSLATDSVQVKKRGFIGRIFKEDYPNPNKALYMALAIPGAGQIYNKRWWKLPLVYGAYTGLILAVDFNTKNYRLYRDAYIAELNDEPHPFSNTSLDADDLRTIRDGYDKNKQLSYIGIFALHLVQAAEAFVDCHLKTFDVSDDLSIQVNPSIEPTPFSGPVTGVGISFVFK